ncbi:hypothetical protein [Mucilaginibacter auburnensis]|uniref:Outer membrane protein with beta-barrel domain n=1 Tax=Mucilaginibacter auburnensis TaxID=1457233 RepID=A0A2H9VTC2_9SPHI|nr:hypothetical protein [Mucilaginibacter auburnensis]PJJ84032.1 hypothetical protein CLV57_1031 [Mucilaginibacter auburnensis]
MKKVLIAAALAFTGFAAQAQIQRGNVLMGGNIANLSLGLDNSKQFSFDLTPTAAWFIEDNLALGGYIDFGVTTAKNSPTITRYGVGALGRYYAGNDVEILRHGRFFGEVNAGFGGINTSNGTGNTNGLALGFGPGFAYFITPNVGLETLLKYKGVAGFGNAAYQSTLTLSLGLQVYLPGRSTANKVKSDMR